VGLDTLAASISEEPETLEDVYEPYLMKLGLLKKDSSRSGRDQGGLPLTKA